MSTIKVDNIRIASESVSRPATGVAAAYAWVDMMSDPKDKDPKGKSLNASTVTYNGLGSYDVNLTAAMVSNYSVSSLNSLRSSQPVVSGNSGNSMAGGDRVIVILKNTNGNSADGEFTMLLHGDLA